MFSVPPLRVLVALLICLRESAAQDFLAKPAIPQEDTLSSVLGVHVSNHSEDVDLVAAARQLQVRPRINGNAPAPKWSKLSEPKQEVNWDKVSTATTAGIGAVTASVELAKDPSVASAGSALTSIGGLAMLAPPPAGPVVGGIMMLTGGLMSIFGAEDEAPSNQDILAAIQSGFAEVDQKLDNIDKRLIAVQAQLASIEAKVDLLIVAVQQVRVVLTDIQRDVEDIFEVVVLDRNTLNNIDDEFAVTMNRLRRAMQDPTLMQEFTERVVKQREDLGQHVNGALSPGNFERLLDFELRAENGRCAAAISYQMMVAVRFKLFFILFMGSVFRCDGSEPQHHCPRMTSATVDYAENLKKDLLAYEQIVKAKGAMELAQLSPSQLAPGMRTPKYVFDASLWRGEHPVHSPALVRDAAVFPVFGTIDFRCDDFKCYSDTCGRLQDLGASISGGGLCCGAGEAPIFGNALRPGSTRITVSSEDCHSEKVCLAGSSSFRRSELPCKLCEANGFSGEQKSEIEHRVRVVPWSSRASAHKCLPLDPKQTFRVSPEGDRYAKCIHNCYDSSCFRNHAQDLAKRNEKQTCVAEVLSGRWRKVDGGFIGHDILSSKRVYSARVGHMFLNKCFQ